MKNVLYSLRHLKTWYQVSGAVQGGYGRHSIAEGHHWERRARRVHSLIPLPVGPLYSPLALSFVPLTARLVCLGGLLPSGTISQSKLFIPHVALAMVFHPSSKKGTDTITFSFCHPPPPSARLALTHPVPSAENSLAYISVQRQN